ncbi:hypothetical protein ACP70R_023902 [Stipagrostis hirtigluma subsp. patula]
MVGKVTGSFTLESDNKVSVASIYQRALVTVSAESTVEERAPIDLVAVLDVSGSMGMAAAPPAMKPSRLDLLKTAMNFIVRQLHDDDGLAVVAFSDKLVTDEYITEITRISGDGRMFAETKIDDLVAKGDTAFKPGLEHAVKVRRAVAYAISQKRCGSSYVEQKHGHGGSDGDEHQEKTPPAAAADETSDDCGCNIPAATTASGDDAATEQPEPEV